MIRPAMTLARDLVRRRLPAGASPSRREDRARSDAQSNAVRTEGGLRRPPGFFRIRAMPRNGRGLPPGKV